MARATFVKKARKAVPSAGIEKGDSYYWWKFRFGGKNYSKTAPTRSQLTQSGFLSELYGIQDNISFDRDDPEGSVQDLCSSIESLRDTCQESLDNMPEHLQESSSSGQLLQERIEALESWQSDLESIDVELDEDDFSDRAKAEWEDLSKEEKKENDKDKWIEEKRIELRDEKIDEIIDELEGVEVDL